MARWRGLPTTLLLAISFTDRVEGPKALLLWPKHPSDEKALRALAHIVSNFKRLGRLRPPCAKAFDRLGIASCEDLPSDA